MAHLEDDQPELIRFVVPNEKSTLFISNLSIAVGDSDVKSLFSDYGLIYSIKLLEPVTAVTEPSEEPFGGPVPSSKTKFGFVRFYSVKAALVAQVHLDKFKWIDSKTLRVRFSNKRKRDAAFVGPKSGGLATMDGQLSNDEFALPITPSIELANFYLGFKGWSSAVLGISSIDPETVPEHLKSLSDQHKTGLDQQTSKTASNVKWTTLAYECQVKHIFKDGRSIVGTGQGIASCLKKTEAIEQGKKIAVTNARKDAFGRMLIVVLPTGKVGLHLLPQSYVTRPTTPCPEDEPSKEGHNARQPGVM